MYPLDPKQGAFQLLGSPIPHGLHLQADEAPGWQHSWLEYIPWIGQSLHILGVQFWRYKTRYEKVADALAEELEQGSDMWVGKRVGYIEKEKLKDA